MGIVEALFRAIFGAPSKRKPRRRHSPTLSVGVELGGSSQTFSRPSKSATDSYSDLLKQATALKRQGDIDGALLRIDRAIAMASPGNTGNHGPIPMYCFVAPLSMLPQDGSSTAAPSPRKLKEASAIMAMPNWKVIITIRIATVLGTRCRKMMRQSDAPNARAAST